METREKKKQNLSHRLGAIIRCDHAGCVFEPFYEAAPSVAAAERRRNVKSLPSARDEGLEDTSVPSERVLFPSLPLFLLLLSYFLWVWSSHLRVKNTPDCSSCLLLSLFYMLLKIKYLQYLSQGSPNLSWPLYFLSYQHSFSYFKPCSHGNLLPHIAQTSPHTHTHTHFSCC